MWILRNFKEKLFYKALPGDSFCAVEKEPLTLEKDKEDKNIISAIQNRMF